MLVDEAKGWVRDLSRSLVRRAVRQLPTVYQEEKQQEWEAEFSEQASKPISSLMWSWRLFRSRRSTAHEMRVTESSNTSLTNAEQITGRPISEEMPPYLRSLIDGLHAYGWQRVASALQDSTLGQVDERLEAATVQFCTLIDEARAVSEAPLPRFGSSHDSYAWNDIYNPEPPKLRPGFHISAPQRQGATPQEEKWPIRLLRNFLALDYRLLWIAAGTFMLLVAGTPVWFTSEILVFGLSIAISTPRKRLAIFFSLGILSLYALYLWPIAMEHGLLGFGEARMIGWALVGLLAVTLIALRDRLQAVSTSEAQSLEPTQVLFVFGGRGSSARRR